MKLLEIIYSAYSLARSGWMLRGVPSSLAETVAEHSYAAALIAAEVAQRVGADPYEAALIALVHDLAETKVGDIAKVAGIPEAKKAAEEAALASLEVSNLIKSLIMEFDEGRAPEAVVAKASDLAATIIISKYYERMGFDVKEIEETSRTELEALASSSGLGERLLNALRELGVI
ncbi:MAG: putative hydrolases of HD superfamily [uncultured Acidilobus sp. MG]|nr:MAG: putative hydrolases of HD superfamily [uncultured Acidilobus sp. MG]